MGFKGPFFPIRHFPPLFNKVQSILPRNVGSTIQLKRGTQQPPFLTKKMVSNLDRPLDLPWIVMLMSHLGGIPLDLDSSGGRYLSFRPLAMAKFSAYLALVFAGPVVAAITYK